MSAVMMYLFSQLLATNMFCYFLLPSVCLCGGVCVAVSVWRCLCGGVCMAVSDPLNACFNHPLLVSLSCMFSHFYVT